MPPEIFRATAKQCLPARRSSSGSFPNAGKASVCRWIRGRSLQALARGRRQLAEQGRRYHLQSQRRLVLGNRSAAHPELPRGTEWLKTQIAQTGSQTQFGG